MEDPETPSIGSSGEASSSKDEGLAVAPQESHEAAVETATVDAEPMTASSIPATTDDTTSTSSATSISGPVSKPTTAPTPKTINGAPTSNGPNKSQNIPPWRSYNGPKLYVKPVSRTSNQQIIHKAIAKALEGAANANTLKKIQETIQANIKTCSHFLILFRNYQFKGIYDYNEKLAAITKLDGLGPKSICPENIVRFFKFDSTKRAFTEVETKQIGPTIIGISLSTFSTK